MPGWYLYLLAPHSDHVSKPRTTFIPPAVLDGNLLEREVFVDMHQGIRVHMAEGNSYATNSTNFFGERPDTSKGGLEAHGTAADRSVIHCMSEYTKAMAESCDILG